MNGFTHLKSYVAGHRGLAGSAICHALAASGYRNLVSRTPQELELTDRGKGVFRERAAGRCTELPDDEFDSLLNSQLTGYHCGSERRMPTR